jgi:predicted DNA-binding transcriptional regulator AlpA
MSDTAASSIRQFCREHGISIPTYYNLKKQGQAPVEMRMGRIIRISAEAAAAWRRARENPSKAEAAETAKISEALRDRAVNAAAKAVASPLHISRRERA